MDAVTVSCTALFHLSSVCPCFGFPGLWLETHPILTVHWFSLSHRTALSPQEAPRFLRHHLPPPARPGCQQGSLHRLSGTRDGSARALSVPPGVPGLVVFCLCPGWDWPGCWHLWAGLGSAAAPAPLASSCQMCNCTVLLWQGAFFSGTEEH